MASRISQMRNGMLQPQQPQQQPQLSEAIARTKALMQQCQAMKNPEAAIMNILQSNPQLQTIIPALRNGSGLENIANQIAQAKGYDINQILTELQGGI